VNAYSVFSYISAAGDFAEDVAALSHEFGELVMDPFTDNKLAVRHTRGRRSLEGDANFGTYPTCAQGSLTISRTWCSSLFRAPAATSLANRSTFQGTNLAVCQNGS